MTTQDKGGDVFHGNLELFRQEILKACGIQNARHADHPAVGQAAGVAQDLDHGVQGIGDTDHKCTRRILLDAGTDLFHHGSVDTNQVIAAHARLAGDAGGHNYDVGATDRRIGLSARHPAVKTFDRR